MKYGTKFTITLLLSFNTFFVLQSEPSEPKVVLTNRILEIVDGMSIGINGQIIGIILQVRKKVLEMVEGKRTIRGLLQGMYEFEGENCSIHSLATLEEELQNQRNKFEQELANTQENFEKSRLQLLLEVIGIRQEKLHQLLPSIKKEFEDAVAPFLVNARSTKEPMIILIGESCEKHNRSNSLLLDWAKIEGDDETESFNKQVTNFTIFHEFCTDLVNFLEDLIRSCPKAQQQFKKLMLEQKKGK